MTTAPVVIAGAGIGGLTAALALHQRGIDAIVVERAAHLKPLGVGINLLPHAVRELDALGLRPDLESISVAPRTISYHESSGRQLFSEPLGHGCGYAYPQRSVHRGRLHDMLLTAVRERLGVGAIHTGTALESFTRTEDGVVIHTPRGDLRAARLIGADGIHSVVRAALHPGPDPLMWSGVRMYRGAARIPAFLDGITMAIVYGDPYQLVTYPIGDGLVNWVLLADDGEPGPLPEHARWNHPADAAAVAARVDGWQLDWLDASALPRHSAEVFEYPMIDRNPLSQWGDDRVTLLGDAAHPMYPVGANGASQAIVDARVLADELATDPSHGLCRYEARRRPETAAVVTANRDMHRTARPSPDAIARATATYRNATERSTS
ncbi:MAG: FAD-dependent monooxygenase [Mycobacterium kyogaense]|uniref:FAD-dependent monooxygenase n=1 Tax=Mycobacterium kyogaense TaxID=2212479 RepID=UPI002FF5C8CD